MSYQERVNERIAVLDGILPAVGTAGDFFTGAVAITGQGAPRRIAFLVQEGTIGSSGTVDASIQWCATSGGTYAAVTGYAITQDTAGSLFQLLEISVEQLLKLQPTAKFIKGKITTGTAATRISGAVIGFDFRYDPPAQGTIVGQVIPAAGAIA